MGAAVGTGSKKLPEPEINVTPLVDVVLVLLIIFMVIAPQLENGERVELPVMSQPDKKSTSKLDPITVTVTASGRIFVEKDVIADQGALKETLQGLHASEPERRVVIKGDSGLRYAAMRETFATCQGVGFPGVSLMVSQKGGRAGEAAPEEG